MPLQIYADPGLAARLTFEGGNALGAGIGGGLSKLGEGAGAYLEKQKKEREEADALRKYLSHRGVNKDVLGTMSLGELRGEEKGIAAEQTAQLQQAHMEAYKAMAAENQAQAQARAAQVSNQGKFSDFMSRFADATAPSMEGMGPVSNEGYDAQRSGLNKAAEALARSGYYPQDVDATLKLFMGNQGQKGLPLGAVSKVYDEGGNEIGTHVGQGEQLAPHFSPTTGIRPWQSIDSDKYPDVYRLDPRLDRKDWIKMLDKLPLSIRKKALTKETPDLPGFQQFIGAQPGGVSDETQDLRRKEREAASGKALPPGQYMSEGEAMKAGKNHGDIIQLWDPRQSRFRPYQIP